MQEKYVLQAEERKISSLVFSDTLLIDQNVVKVSEPQYDSYKILKLSKI